MLHHLDRKLGRDLSRMKGQAIAVSLVMACGLAMMTMSRSLIRTLETTRHDYYQIHRFADLFVSLKRAPLSLAAQAGQIPGVASVQAGISAPVTLDLPDLLEPASGLVRSIPDTGEPELNRLYLRAGRWLTPESRGEILVGEAFAEANRLRPGDGLTLLLNGRKQQLRIAGIVLSPEYVFESRPGAALPDNRTYGIFWMAYEEVAKSFDLYGAFNHLTLTLAPQAMERPIIAALDRLLEPYGGRGAYGRSDHPSHIRVSDEIRVLHTLSIGFPTVFLGVAAFMTHAVLARLLAMQREQIAILKAFGFSHRAIVVHYLKFALVMVAAGLVFGSLGGMVLGRQLVAMYHMFFRFPSLDFRFDTPALLWALVAGVSAAIFGVLSSIRRAARVPPAEAMRPEPPARYRVAWIERTGLSPILSHTFRMAVRNIERRPTQALFTIAGLALATGILIVPNAFRDGVARILRFQWDVIERNDVSLGLVEPEGMKVFHLFAQWPGVITAEPFRAAAARVRFGHHQRQLAVRGLPEHGEHLRIIDASHRRIAVPRHGLAISAILGRVLNLKLGDVVDVQFLEGQQRSVALPVVGLADDLAGISAYMELGALNRLLQEGDLVSGATLTVDRALWPTFLRGLKAIPRVSWVAIKRTLRANFEKSTAASINLIQSIYLVFAVVVAFGVIYNNARISLAERSRELATLRVIGFSVREVGSILVTELTLLTLIAIPVGLLLGTAFASSIIQLVNTETVRLPLVLLPSNYAFAASIVLVASWISAALVLRRLRQLDLVGALKAPE